MSNKGRIITTLVRKENLSPHLIRCYLTADHLEQFAATTIGDNNKIAVPPAGLNEVHFPEYDMERHEWKYPPADLAPKIRTYTHRGLDLEKKELIIDFVNHGETGPASSWAIHAKPGAKLGVMMRTEASELFAPADWYLLAGDATAIPVLSAILEALPETAAGVCIIEVSEAADIIPLATDADIEFRWVINDQPEHYSKIYDEVRMVLLPSGSKFGYVAAEFSAVKAIRQYLRKEKNWTNKELYAYSYWKAGAAEDQSQADRQREKNEFAG